MFELQSLRNDNGDLMRTCAHFLLFCIQSVFWFFVCGLVWATFCPLDNIQRLAHMLSIYGIEDVYDFASLLDLSVSTIGALGITIISMKYLYRKM